MFCSGLCECLTVSVYFKVIAYNAEGKSGPSEVVEFLTCPDKPGPPPKPSVKGKVHAQSVRIVWGKFSRYRL